MSATLDPTTATIASTLIDAAVAGAVLWAPGRARESGACPRIGLGRVLAAVVATSVAFIAKQPLLGALGVNAFGAMRAAYLDLVLVPSVAGLLVLCLGRRWNGQAAPRRVTMPVRILAIGLLPAAPLGAYATFVAPFNLKLETASAILAPERSGGVALGIGVLADLQTDRITDHERAAVQQLMAQKPDVIMLAGDLFQGTDEEFDRELPALRELLGQLSAPGGVYCILGNVDQPTQVTRALEGTDVRLLLNEIVRTTVRDRQLTIGGLSWPCDSPSATRVVAELESAPGDKDVRVLLAHTPDASYLLTPGSRVDLTVAGHTHGGQIQLPIVGPLLTACHSTPRKVAAGGLHDLEGRRVYVSRGVGHERRQAPRVRFLCPPEVSLVTLCRP